MKASFPTLRPCERICADAVAGADTIAPTQRDGYPWGTVGMAVDYRIRFNFAEAASLPSRWSKWVADPEAPFATPVGDAALPDALVAELGASKPVQIYEAYTWRRSAGAFFGELARFLGTACPHELSVSDRDEERLCRFCFALGLYEEFYRSTYAWSGSPMIDLGASGGGFEDLLDLCPPDALKDLTEVSAAFIGSQHGLLNKPAVLNPTFADSKLIGGADGDLIADGCYIDIKTTTDPKKPSPTQWPWENPGICPP